jgi:hypothetical protein
VGHPDQKTYLFLMQNNNEIRPGGGFIGTYGIIKVKDGNLISFQTDNIYNLDVTAIGRLQIEPPDPIKENLSVKSWYMRDANWWPDYPTSAKKVEELYHLEAAPGERIDGVIAINPDLVEDLLKLVGPIQVADLELDSDNFTQELQYQVEFGYYKQGIPESERKDIIGDLANQLQERLYNLPVEQWPALLKVIQANLDRKHILAYFKSQELQQFIEERNWAGQVASTKDDYLQVVDANLAALKTDAVMERTVNYTLTPDNGGYKAVTAISYKNLGVFTEFTTRYRSYTRLYVPAGSKLIQVKVGKDILPLDRVDIYNEFDKTAFGLFLEVEPQQSKTISFEYQLPQHVVDSTKDGDYKLLVQKQPGIREFDLNLDLTFPEKIKLFDSKKDEPNQIFFDDVLKKDQLYTVLFR